MNALVDAVRPTGAIGVVGVFVPEDPGAEDDLAKKGQMAFDFGTFFFKGQTMGTGQANVKNYNRQLRDLIHRDKVEAVDAGVARARLSARRPRRTRTSTTATTVGRRSC